MSFRQRYDDLDRRFGVHVTRFFHGGWRRLDYRWLVMLPAFLIIWLSYTYASISVGFTSPERIITGAKGLEILDRNGEMIFTFADDPGSSKVVPLAEVSPHLINATVAAEDANFWNNPGVNLKGLARAVYENLAFWETGGFFKGSGGSSLSQQLAKNLYIAPEDRIKRSPVRKIKETIYAFELNRRYSKEQILSWYVSNVFYGHGAYGIESASFRYFNKPPAELTLAEATLLAGIPRAPAVYDPISNYEVTVERQHQVIDLMERHGFINAEEAAATKAEPIALREGRDPNSRATLQQLAPHFSLYVRDLLPSLLGKEKVEGQLRVTTTLDASLQAEAEEIVTTNLDTFEKTVGASNGALVSMDPRTGEILAMVGSHDFERDDISGQVNNALALNQPGSTMKPITYLTAFQKGWAPSTIVADEPYRVADGESSYILNNADLRYRGNVSVRNALGSSLNVPAVKALEYAGLPQVYATAKHMGLSSLKGIEYYGFAFTLGGADVSLLDMTYAYAVLANQGEQAGISSVLGLPEGNRPLDPIAVLRVENVEGKTLYTAHGRRERIVPAATTYLITNILSDESARLLAFAPNSPLLLRGRPAAVKSGTSDSARDAWAIGYTPELVTGVWVGNANNAPMPGASSTYTAAPIWNGFMTAALQGQPVLQFPVPSGVQFAQVCAETGQAPQRGCRVVNEVFLSGRVPAGAPDPNRVTPTRPAPSPSPTRTATPERDRNDREPSPSATPSSARTPVVTGTPGPSLTPVQPTSIIPTATPTPRSNRPTPEPSPTPRRGQRDDSERRNDEDDE